MAKRFKLSPSLMCADMLHLQDELALFDEQGVEYLHIDIMDGHYVPNVALGPQLCEQIGSASTIPLDVHLMVENVDSFIPLFTAVKPRFISFHPETSRHPVRTIQRIRESGAQPGVAIDPAITVGSLRHLLPEVGLVCVMSVNPGYAGQALVPWTLDKIAELKELRGQEGFSFEIEVDGNASWENIPKMVEAGAEIIVAGTSSLFSSEMSRLDAFRRMRELDGGE